MGYCEVVNDSVVKVVGRRIAPLGASSLSPEELNAKKDLFNKLRMDPEWWFDVNGISNVFGIHVLATNLIRRPEDVYHAYADKMARSFLIAEGQRSSKRAATRRTGTQSSRQVCCMTGRRRISRSR
jgi:hypothetical protein